MINIKTFNTQQKVIAGFIVNLVILMVVGLISLNVVWRLNKLVESTEQINGLLLHIYQVRINEKNIRLFDHKEKMVIEIDSLSRSIHALINDIEEQEYDHQLVEQLEQIPPLVDQYNQLLYDYIRVEHDKTRYQQQINEVFEQVDSLLFRSGIWTLKVLTSEDRYQTVLSTKKVFQQLYYLRHIELTGEKSTLSKESKDSIRQIIGYLNNFTNDASLHSVHPKVQDLFKRVNLELRTYEVNQNGLIEAREQQFRIENRLAAHVQQIEGLGEDANRMTAVAISNMRLRLSNLIGVLIILAILSSGLLAFVFIRQIKADERMREASEKALSDNRNFLDSIIRNNPALITVKTHDGRYTLVNEIWEKTMQKDASEVIGQTSEDVFEPELAEHFTNTDKQVLHTKRQIQFENEFTYNNIRHNYLTSKFPIFDSNQEIISICSISSDISLLKKAQRDLEISRENYSNMVRNVPGIVFKGLNDPQRTMLFLSEGFDQITGFSSEDCIAGRQYFVDMVIEDDRNKLMSILLNPRQVGRQYEFEYRIKDSLGQIRWLHEKGTFMSGHENGTVSIQGVMVDVTPQKEVLSEVIRRDRFLEGVAEAVKELIVNADPDTAISRSLRIIGQSAGVDRSFVFKNTVIEPHQPVFSHVYEWAKGKIEPIERPHLSEVLYEKYIPSWYHMLADKKEVLGYSGDFATEEQQFFDWLELSSILLVPIFVKNEFWGFLGFGYHQPKIRFSDSQRAIFKAFAVTLGIAIAKDHDALLLLDAKDAAEAATRAKSDFLARMSHEIRTPMNAIVGWTHLAMDKNPDPHQFDYLKKIQASSRSLLGIINDILDFSKIEAGKLDFEHIDFDLEIVFSDLSGMVAYKACEKGLELTFDISPNVPLSLTGDPLRLGQVLINLVNNAVKFTPSGEIVIRVDAEPIKDNRTTLLFSVIDTGIGIKPEQQENLFDSFSQADVSTTRRYGGTGLGLSICKRLVNLMGGEIWVESDFGSGSTFSFTVIMEVQPYQKKNELNAVVNGLGKLVVVMDARLTSGDITRNILEEFDYKVSMVGDPEQLREELLLSLTDRTYSLAIIDCSCTTVNEITLIHQIRQIHSSIPIVVLSLAFGNEDLSVKIRNIPGVSLVLKPFTYTAFFDSILQSMGQKSITSGTKEKEHETSLSELRNIKQVRILLVEDNEANQQIGVELLELAGIEVVVAENGKEAIECLRRSHNSKFDMVLMDIQMPLLDGYSATEAIRKMTGFENLPIIAMTADAIEGTRERCLHSGMNDMIAKPIDPDVLYRYILRYLDKETTCSNLSSSKSLPSQSIETPSVHFEIKGININEGLRRVVNRWDFYEKLITRFYHDHIGFIDNLKQTIASNDRATAERMLHSFKGITGTIAANDLYHLSIETEAAFKNNHPMFPSLLDNMDQMLNELLQEIKSNKNIKTE